MKVLTIFEIILGIGLLVLVALETFGVSICNFGQLNIQSKLAFTGCIFFVAIGSYLVGKIDE